MRIQKIYHLGLEELYGALNDCIYSSLDDLDVSESYTVFREFVTDFLENIARDAIERELGDSIIFTLTFQGKVQQSPLHSIALVYNIDPPYTVCISILATLVDRAGFHDEINSLFYSADAVKPEPEKVTTDLADRTLVALEQLRTTMINIKQYATVPKDGSVKREIMRLLAEYTDNEYQVLEFIRDRLDQLENPK